MVGLCRIAEPVCKAMATKDLKQRPGTVKRVADACLAFVELEQAEAVLVRTIRPSLCAMGAAVLHACSLCLALLAGSK